MKELVMPYRNMMDQIDSIIFKEKEEIIERLKNKGFTISENNSLDYLKCIDMWDEYKTLTQQQ